MNRLNPMTPATRCGLFRAVIRSCLVATLLCAGAGTALAQARERALAADARGDVRAAQLEWRNAVRQTPESAANRAALAASSLELGDDETAAREARASLERGLDPAEGNALLARAYLSSGRFDELLRAMPEPAAGTPGGGQIAAGRAIAQIALGQLEAARASVGLALQIAPSAPEPELAAAALAMAANDRAAAEAAVDRVLARDPNAIEGLLRKGSFQLERRETAAAIANFDRAIARAPGNVSARLRRADVLLQTNELARARLDVDAALAVLPGSPTAIYLKAVLQARAQDWAGVDASLQRISPMLGNFPDGFLMLSVAKRELGQTAQAEDAARRHLARRPQDLRGAKLVAALELEANRPEAAIAVLKRLVDDNIADAVVFDLLGRLYAGTGRQQDAVTAFQRAATLAPNDSGVLSRLAAARLATGDVAGTAAAANDALRLDPQRQGAREMLAFTALYRGDTAGVMAELDRLDPTARRSEAAGVLQGTLQLLRLELDQARASFTAVLRAYPNSVAARMGLVRVGRLENRTEEVDRLLAEVLRAEPSNVEASANLAVSALAPGPRGTAARRSLEAAQAAAPGEPLLALTLANVLLRTNDPAKAVTVLASEPLRAQRGVAIILARAEAHAAAGQWAEAEAASRLAVAQAPESVAARRQLAGLMVRAGDTRGAETLIEQGLRAAPASPVLQQTLVNIVRQARGLDAALMVADRLGAQAAAQPAGRMQRGDLLYGAQRPQDAANAYAEAFAQAPSSALAIRLAGALSAAGKPNDASAALRTWLQREPQDDAAELMLSQLDIAANRMADAERRLSEVVARRPDDAVALNNLGWLIGQRGGDEAASRARALAERAYFLAPNPDTADTLGWILARAGLPSQAVALLRQAAAAQPPDRRDPASAYRLAFALREAGEREEALALLGPIMAASPSFPEKAEAERLLADLRSRR